MLRTRAKLRVRIPLEMLRRGTGAGTIAKKVFAALGIQPCKGCDKRAEALNRFKVRW